MLLNYICRAVGKKLNVILNEEGREFKWLKLADAKKLKLNKPTKILIEAVEAKISEGRVKRVPKPKKSGTRRTRPSHK